MKDKIKKWLYRWLYRDALADILRYTSAVEPVRGEVKAETKDN